MTSPAMSSPVPGPAAMSGSNLFGEIRRFARTSGAVGGIAARVAGAAGVRHQDRPRRPRRRPEDHPRRPEGPADEGRAVPVHRPRRAAGGICRGTGAASVQRARRWAGTSSAVAWRANWARTGSRNLPRSATRRPPPPASGRCTAPRCRTAPTSPASCSTPICRARWRPICGSSSWRWRSITGWTTPSSRTRSTRNCGNACGRNWITSGRPRRCGCTA